MAYNTVPSVAPLDSWTSSQHNTYIKDNLTALWPYTTAGDTAYATASNALGRLAIGAAGAIKYSTGSAPAWLAPGANGAILKNTGSAPEWVALGAANAFLRSDGATPTYSGLVYRRQGGSSTNWQTAGSTTYTPASTVIQCGSADVSITSGNGIAAISYPSLFTYRPIMFTSINGSPGKFVLRHTNDTTGGFDVVAYDSELNTGLYQINWLAIGQ